MKANRMDLSGKQGKRSGSLCEYRRSRSRESKLKCDDVIIQWIIRRAAMMVSRYIVGKDGRTSYEQIRSRAEHQLPRSGRKSGTSRSASRRTRPQTGTRGGKETSSRSLREPQRGQTNREHLMVLIRVRFDPPQVGEPDPMMQPRKEPEMRRTKIAQRMLQKHPYTEGCEGCRAKAAGMIQTPHGEACRKRTGQALGGDGAGRQLRRKNTERENQRIADKTGGSRQNRR